MISKVLVFSLIAAGCVVAAAGGAYVAVRQSAVPAVVEAVPEPASAPATAAASAAVSETEAIVERPATPTAAETAATPVSSVEPKPPQVLRAPRASAPRNPERSGQPGRTSPTTTESAIPPPVSTPERPTASESAPVPATPAAEATVVEPPRQDPPAPQVPEFEEVVVPAGSVIGLQVTSPLSSERTQIEDRVEARVTRDVTSAGRVAIPAGSRAIGSVTVVERGGKMKERARLGVRFHTLVLGDGSEIPLRTDGIFREGQSPSGESARKIGGAAVGGAILGAILGGGKGAAIGGATGAAGGTAVVMAGERNAAVLAAGETVTVRLTSPFSVEVRKDK